MMSHLTPRFIVIAALTGGGLLAPGRAAAQFPRKPAFVTPAQQLAAFETRLAVARQLNGFGFRQAQTQRQFLINDLAVRQAALSASPLAQQRALNNLLTARTPTVGAFQQALIANQLNPL